VLVPNRREFVKTVAGATVALCAGERVMRAQTPAARRQVSVAGKRVKVIDVHAHWDMPLGDVVKGTPYEKDRATGPGLDDRIAAMDKLGVDVEAISVNDFWWWEIKDQGLARAICNKHNETLAAWSRQHPDRFVGMASIPLQFPDVAVTMLEDATKRLGARAVAIGGHVNGESLSAPTSAMALPATATAMAMATSCGGPAPARRAGQPRRPTT